MDCTDLLLDSFERVHELLPVALDGLTAEDLRWRPDPGANSMAWLTWHLARVQDDHLAGIAGTEQVWTSAGFRDRFALPYRDGEIGYGQGPDDVAAFPATEPSLFIEYHDAVHARTAEVLRAMGEDDWSRVIDERWDPPVTVAVRLVSVVNDITQHIGQVGYVRGLLERASSRDSGWRGHA